MLHFHGVRFYASVDSMASTAAVFSATAFLTDESALVIARPGHRAAIERAFRSIGFNVGALKASERLHLLDAEATLRSLLVSAHPDPVRFGTIVAAAIRRLKRRDQQRVRVYDGMSDLLEEQGGHRGALRLEALWDGLAVHDTCAVLCGHSVHNIPNGSATAASICACHSHVIAPDGRPHPMTRLAAAVAGQRPNDRPFIH